MKENKVFVSQQMISYIKRKRKELSISAYKLSELCGQGKYWINNIENGRTKTLPEEDALKIYNILDDAEYNRIQNDFLQKIESGELDADDLFGEAQDEISDVCFDAEQHKKELKKMINVAHEKMLRLLEKIDYEDDKSIEKYEPYIRCYTALFTSLSGQACFKKLFKYPIQFAADKELDEIAEIIKSSVAVEYVIEYDVNGKPYLSQRISE